MIYQTDVICVLGSGNRSRQMPSLDPNPTDVRRSRGHAEPQ